MYRGYAWVDFAIFPPMSFPRWFRFCAPSLVGSVLGVSSLRGRPVAWRPGTYSFGGMLGPNTNPTNDETKTNPPSQPSRGERLLNRSFGGWLFWMVSARVSFRGGFVSAFPPGRFGPPSWGHVGSQHQPDQRRTHRANPGRYPHRPESGQDWAPSLAFFGTSY